MQDQKSEYFSNQDEEQAITALVLSLNDHYNQLSLEERLVRNQEIQELWDQIPSTNIPEPDWASEGCHESSSRSNRPKFLGLI